MRGLFYGAGHKKFPYLLQCQKMNPDIFGCVLMHFADRLNIFGQKTMRQIVRS